MALLIVPTSPTNLVANAKMTNLHATASTKDNALNVMGVSAKLLLKMDF